MILQASSLGKRIALWIRSAPHAEGVWKTVSTKVFELDAEDNGVRVSVDGYFLYTEVPGGPPPGILDGFMTSLLGLYDVFMETGDSVVGQL